MAFAFIPKDSEIYAHAPNGKKEKFYLYSDMCLPLKDIALEVSVYGLHYMIECGLNEEITKSLHANGLPTYLANSESSTYVPINLSSGSKIMMSCGLIVLTSYDMNFELPCKSNVYLPQNTELINFISRVVYKIDDKTPVEINRVYFPSL